MWMYLFWWGWGEGVAVVEGCGDKLRVTKFTHEYSEKGSLRIGGGSYSGPPSGPEGSCSKGFFPIMRAPK